MKNRDLYTILEGLEKIKQIPYNELAVLGPEKTKYIFNSEFVLSVARNKKKITEALQELEKVREPSEKFLEYQNKRRDLTIRFAKKDDSGNPIKTVKGIPGGGSYESYIIEDISNPENPFNIEMEKLNKQYESERNEQLSKEEHYLSLMREDVKLNFARISKEIIPMGLTIAATESLIEFVDL